MGNMYTEVKHEHVTLKRENLVCQSFFFGRPEETSGSVVWVQVDLFTVWRILT